MIHDLEVLNSRTVFLTLGCIVAFRILLFVGTVFYNLYLHPLRKFPGPRSWIAFPALENITLLKGTREYKLREFHEKYGDVVRCGVDQLSFICAPAWKDICGHGHAELPKHYPPEARNFAEAPSIISANAPDHFRFRRAMLPAFSEKALGQQEKLMKVYIQLLSQRLREAALSGNPTNMVDWYTLTTFDMIGDLAFGQSFDGLGSGKSNEWVDNIAQLMKLFPILATVGMLPWFVKSALLWLAGDKIRNSQRQHQQKVKELTVKRIENSSMEHRGDFMDLIMRSRGLKHELSDDELASNSDTLIIAGSETTATLLSGVTYYLLANPETLKQCVTEVRETYHSLEEIDFKSVSTNLPYTLACLSEALRLFPPVPILLPRITLPGSMTPIAGFQIPPNTVVGVHQLSAYHSPRNFHRARDFCPERWLPEEFAKPESPFYNDNREVHKPFSFGPRDCIGRNLAFHEMRLILAHVLWQFDLTLCKESEGWAENQKIFALWEKPPLMVQIAGRQLIAQV